MVNIQTAIKYYVPFSESEEKKLIWIQRNVNLTFNITHSFFCLERKSCKPKIPDQLESCGYLLTLTGFARAERQLPE